MTEEQADFCTCAACFVMGLGANGGEFTAHDQEVWAKGFYAGFFSAQGNDTDPGGLS